MLIKRIQPMPLAKISGVLNAVLGIVMGVFFCLVTLAMPFPQPHGQQFPGWSLFFGFGAIVFLPFFYGAFGFVSGLIGASLYNALSRYIGGIVIQVE
jgi:hypothetical protein